MKLSQLAFALITNIYSYGAEPTSAIANLESNGFKATIKFTRVGNCRTEIELNFYCMPNFQGQTPYPWHVHEKPIDSTGNCMSAGLHLDPAGLNPGGNSPNYNCDPKNPAKTCELGDLSGKFGYLYPNQKNYRFSDPDLLLYGKDGIIGRSIVVHLADSTRIVCANITEVY